MGKRREGQRQINRADSDATVSPQKNEAEIRRRRRYTGGT